MTTDRTTDPTSKTERGIDYVLKLGRARTPEIAEHVDIEPKNVVNLLRPATDAGLLIVCKIERPGAGPINEYRVSAVYSDTKLSWKEFKQSKVVNQTKAAPIKVVETKPARQNAGQLVPVAERVASVPITKVSAPENQVSETREQIESESQKTAISKNGGITANPELVALSLDNKGQLRILFGGHRLELDPENTRELGEFMLATEPAWN